MDKMEREGAPRMKSDLSERDIVELLRYSRHDWLNHIQLINAMDILKDKYNKYCR